jgi:hypothetical protein
VNIKIATNRELDTLTQMNVMLRKEEKMDNTLTELEIKNRMDDFIRGSDYVVLLFIVKNKMIGYAVIRTNSNPLYIRQLFIKEECRNCGFGKESLNQIMDYFKLSEIDTEVMS